MKRLATGALVLLAACLALGACGVPLSSAPSPIPAADIPAGLQAQSVLPPLVCLNKPQEKTISIYLLQVENQNLVRVDRCIPSSQRLTVQGVLRILEGGPVANESNYTTDINENSDLVSLGPKPTGVGRCPSRPSLPKGGSTTTTAPAESRPRCGLATVRLDRYFTELTGVRPIAELAQVVWSLHGSGLGVTEVLFLSPNGGPIAVETATGRFVKRPVTIGDYRNIGI